VFSWPSGAKRDSVLGVYDQIEILSFFGIWRSWPPSTDEAGPSRNPGKETKVSRDLSPEQEKRLELYTQQEFKNLVQRLFNLLRSADYEVLSASEQVLITEEPIWEFRLRLARQVRGAQSLTTPRKEDSIDHDL